MRRLIVGIALAAIVGLLATSAIADDTAIAQNIVEQLRVKKQSGALKGFDVGVRVQNGDVWLEGQVSNAAQEAMVLDIARRVPGVRQVVDDVEVAPPAPSAPMAVPAPSSPGRSLLSGVTAGFKSAIAKGLEQREIAASTQAAGAASQIAAAPVAASAPAPVLPPVKPRSIQPGMAGMPTLAANRPAPKMANPTGVVSASNASLAALTNASRLATQQSRQSQVNQMPVAFAPASTVMPAQAMMNAPPAPAYIPGTGGGVAPAQYDHPHMPGYAWPAYASYPNYAGLTYPRQYSPTAWPYIGPFYPYPQVPLGWRKVMLEWDDGWWMLDFKSVDHKH
jgi:hypothetical protein